MLEQLDPLVLHLIDLKLFVGAISVGAVADETIGLHWCCNYMVLLALMLSVLKQWVPAVLELSVLEN